MRAKFIKHNNPRDTLGIGILNKRDFNSYEEFIDWLYRYLIPDFYNIPNGPKLWDQIKKLIMEEKLTVIPQELYYYITNGIIPDVKINGMNIGSWKALDLRKKYPFPLYNKDL